KGLLKPVSEENVTVVNANLVADQRGLRIVERKDPAAADGVNSLVSVRVSTSTGAVQVGATVEHGEPRVVLLDGLDVDIPGSAANVLILENQDVPGMIGKVGTTLGKFDINISRMTVGRKAARGRAYMVLGVDEAPTDDQIRQLE